MTNIEGPRLNKHQQRIAHRWERIGYYTYMCWAIGWRVLLLYFLYWLFIKPFIS